MAVLHHKQLFNSHMLVILMHMLTFVALFAVALAYREKRIRDTVFINTTLLLSGAWIIVTFLSIFAFVGKNYTVTW